MSWWRQALSARWKSLILFASALGVIALTSNMLWEGFRRNQATLALTDLVLHPHADWASQAAEGRRVLTRFSEVWGALRTQDGLSAVLSQIADISTDPSLAEVEQKRAWVIEGELLYERGQFRQTIEVWEQALALDPVDPTLLYRLWQTYVELGDLVSSEQQITRLANLAFHYQVDVPVSDKLMLVGFHVVNEPALRYGFPLEVVWVWKSSICCETPICAIKGNTGTLYGVESLWYQQVTTESLLSNGAFEDPGPGVNPLRGWLPDTVRQPADLPPGIGWEAGSGGAGGRSIAHLSIVTRDRSKVTSDLVPLERNKLYIVAGLGKIQGNGEAYIYRVLYNVSNLDRPARYGPVGRTAKEDWNVINGLFTLPGEADYGQVWLFLTGERGSQAWFDDILLLGVEVPSLDLVIR